MQKPAGHTDKNSQNSWKYLLFLIILGFIGYLLAPEIRFYADKAYYGATDYFDSRPKKYVLFIGNSRTFYYDMPGIVRKIADSAGSKNLYIIEQHTTPGGQLEDHLASPKLQKLLQNDWDEIVIQGGGPENYQPLMREQFYRNGEALIAMVKPTNPVPKLFLSWAFAREEYDIYNREHKEWFENSYLPWYQYMVETGFPEKDRRIIDIYTPDFYPYDQANHFRNMQIDYIRLAQMTGAEVVNIGQAAESLRHSAPSYEQLTIDATHPTIQVSYLTALMFFAAFEKTNDVSAVSYIPSGVSEKEGKHIRNIVNSYLQGMKQ
jgi:hypothetical protein